MTLALAQGFTHIGFGESLALLVLEVGVMQCARSRLATPQFTRSAAELSVQLQVAPLGTMFAASSPLF